MAKPPRITLISHNSETVASWIELLQTGGGCDYEPRFLTNKSTLRDDLLDVINDCLGVSDGTLPTDAVIIDTHFPLDNGTYFILQNLDPSLPGEAGSAVSLLEGAGVPVLVNLENVKPQEAWKLGATASSFITAKTLVSDIRTALDLRKFNPQTLQVENDFAEVYDEQELAGAATVSAIIRENEFVLEYVKEHAKGTRNLRVLDMGCGTGRFEELLLTDADFSGRVCELHAVDFAPRYLIEAKTRLLHFLGAEEMSKIHFHRRIAEDSRFPNDFFDVVIASFGIVCFSRFHLTLPELRRIMRPGGLVVLNGYNRNAITYDFEKLMVKTRGRPASHFAIRIDRDENVMYLGGSTISCFTFYLDDLIGILKLIGLRPIVESGRTFPALYGSARKEYLQQLGVVSKAGMAKTNHLHIRGSCLRKGPCKKFASYQTANLLKDPMNSGFNETIHRMDEDMTALLPNQGYYFCLAAHK